MPLEPGDPAVPADLLRRAVDAIAAQPDPARRAVDATAFMAALAGAGEEVKAIRKDAMAALQDQGLGYGRIADLVGISKSRAQQILAGLVQPARPGRIEVEARLRAERLRASGSTDRQVAAALVPWIRAQPGGTRFEARKVAAMLSVPEPAARAAWTADKR